MTTHKDLPPSSRKWATEVDADRARINELEAIVRRLTANMAVDYAQPALGINSGSAPSVANPVMLKLPSLQDLDIRDAVDGDLLTFDGRRGVWVARAHDTVVLPKVFPVGDPDSYYTPSTPPSGTYAENLFPNPELRTAGTGILPKWIQSYYEEISGTFTQPAAGDGSKTLRLTGGGTGTYLQLNLSNAGGAWPAYLDTTKKYILSVDLTISSPVPDFYPYEPFKLVHAGGDFILPYAAALTLTPGTYRAHLPLTQESGTWLNASIESSSGYIEWSNFQVTETTLAFTRYTSGIAPNTETIDVTSSLVPGSSYLVNDEIKDGDGLTYSFSIEATTPSGSTVLWSRNEAQWPQAIVTIPADATSVSYTHVKPSTGALWHNIDIMAVPPNFGYFEGSTTDTAQYTYSWAGTADDSTSIRNPN